LNVADECLSPLYIDAAGLGLCLNYAKVSKTPWTRSALPAGVSYEVSVRHAIIVTTRLDAHYLVDTVRRGPQQSTRCCQSNEFYRDGSFQ